MKKKTKEDFIGAHKLYNGVYVTGLFYSGITIYNQQVRTLNLLYQLKKAGNLQSTPRKIVIIGGGISGVTAALGLTNLGYEVSILEEKSILLHLQHGCTIRKIHPNLYKWPSVDSLKPFTELPFANWTSSDAASIERSLVAQFNDEKKRVKESLTSYFQVSKVKINISKKIIRFKYKNLKDNSFDCEIKYSLILIAK